MRRPVNEPGPTATARPSRSSGRQRASRMSWSTALITRSECVTRTSSAYSPTTRAPSSSAAPPASVEVSMASTRIGASLARTEKAPEGREGPRTCDNTAREDRMTAAPRKDPVAVEAEVREKIHLEILKRTGAYHSNDHVLLPSGQHTSEYIEKTLVTTEPSFTEGLGAVIAKHFAQWPVDVVLSTGPGALILSHCVA